MNYKPMTPENWKVLKIFGIGFFSGIIFFSILFLLFGFIHRRGGFYGMRGGFFGESNIRGNYGNSMMNNGPMGPGEGPGRMFDKFCKDGKILSGDEFIKRFQKGAEDRFQKANFIRQSINSIISKAKKEGKDTTNIEKKIKEIDEFMSGFKGGKDDFMNNPQNFCDKKPEWENINNQMKQKMMEVGQEIDSLKNG